MSYDGNGNWTYPTGTAAVTGQVIDSTKYNALLTDLQTALTKAFLRDGQSASLANLPMGGYKFTGLGAGTTNGDSVRYEQIADLAAATTIDGVLVGWRAIPTAAQTTYTAVLGDSGKAMLHTDAGAHTMTIPANASVAYPVGTCLTFVNQFGAGVVTIAITTDTMRLAGAGTTGSRTLATGGIATAMKITSTEWIISGTGLT